MPLGESRGWPGEGEIDFAQVRKRVDGADCLALLVQVLHGSLKSPFKEDAVKQWTAKGRFGMRSIMSQCAFVLHTHCFD